MEKYLEILLVNLGLPGALIALIVFMVKSQTKNKEKEIKASHELRKKELETSEKNNDKLAESIKSLAYEFSQAYHVNVELNTKTDIHSKAHIESIERIEAQIIAIHGRINTAGEKDTKILLKSDEILTRLERILDKTDKCNK